MDQDQLPVPYANTQLISYSNGDLFIGAASDSVGIVTYNKLATDSYFLIIKYLGYQTDTIPNISIEANQILDLGVHELTPDDYLLEEVSIVVERPKMIVKENGDFSFKPGSTTIGQNDDADALLETVPGVSFNSQTGYAINGNANIVVLVDGRQISGDQSTVEAYIQTIDAQNIESIEVIKAGALKYDARASGGVLNIITKKSSYAGINGFIYNRYRQGQFGSDRTRFSLNWKYKKFSGAVFYEFMLYKGYHEISTNRNILRPNDERVNFSEEVYEDWKYLHHVPRFFLNYDINDNHRIGILLDFKHNTTKFDTDNSVMPSRNNLPADSTINTYIYQSTKDVWPAFNFNYSANIKGKGNKLNLAYDYFYKDVDKQLDYNNQVFNLQRQLTDVYDFQRLNDFNQPVHTASVDFSRGFKRDMSIDVGAKGTFLVKKNDSKLNNVEEGNIINVPSRSNKIRYEENIYAAYANWAKQFNGWNVSLGLRTEYTDIKQQFDEAAEVVTNNYLDFFPSVSFNKSIDNKLDVRLSYNRGLRRPNFVELEPVEIEVGPFLISEGNPTLRPQVNNVLALDFTIKNKYTLYANYNLTNYSINVFLEKLDNDIYKYTFENFDRSHQFNFGGSATTKIKDWWRIQTNVNLYFDKYNFTQDQNELSEQGFAVAASVNNQFILPKKFFIDVAGKFESPRYFALEKFKSAGYLNLGVTKKLFDDRLTIRARVLDVFRTRQINTSQDYLNLAATYRELSDSRRFELLVNFRFRKGLNFKSKKNQRSNDAERGRS